MTDCYFVDVQKTVWKFRQNATHAMLMLVKTEIISNFLSSSEDWLSSLIKNQKKQTTKNSSISHAILFFLIYEKTQNVAWKFVKM